MYRKCFENGKERSDAASLKEICLIIVIRDTNRYSFSDPYNVKERKPLLDIKEITEINTCPVDP